MIDVDILKLNNELLKRRLILTNIIIDGNELCFKYKSKVIHYEGEYRIKKSPDIKYDDGANDFLMSMIAVDILVRYDNEIPKNKYFG